MSPEQYNDLIKYATKQEAKEYAEAVVWLNTKYIDEKQFNKYHNQFFENLKRKKQESLEHEKLMYEYLKNGNDQVGMKMYGPAHSGPADDDSHFYINTVNMRNYAKGEPEK